MPMYVQQHSPSASPECVPTLGAGPAGWWAGQSRAPVPRTPSFGGPVAEAPDRLSERAAGEEVPEDGLPLHRAQFEALAEIRRGGEHDGARARDLGGEPESD